MAIETTIPTIVATAIGVFTSILSLILNKQKSKKAKLVELAKIAQKVSNYIIEAENIFGKGNGTAKLAFTLNKIQMDCIQNKICFNEDEWKAEIERILETPQKKEIEK